MTADRQRQHDHDAGGTERFGLAERGAKDGLWEVELATGDVYMSDRAVEILGVDPAPADLSSWYEYVHPVDRDVLTEAAAAHLGGATDHLAVEVRLLAPGGEIRWILVRGQKDELDAPRQMAGSITDTTEAHQSEQSLRFQALHDSLTGLPNRTHLMEELNRHLAREQRDPSMHVALLFLDLVGFKAINDVFGHATGDEILRVVGRRLRFATRPEDLPARLGGDEFVVVIAGGVTTDEASVVSERIVALLRQPITIQEHDHVVVPSAGLVTAPTGTWSPEDLLRRADMAMYRAKRAGSTEIEIYEVDGDEQRSAAVSSLAGAAAERRLLMHYEPIVRIDTRAVVGYEALLRWRHPTRGVICTTRDSADIDPQVDRRLSRWALRHAIEDGAAALRDGRNVPGIAVNLSRIHLVDSTTPADLFDLLMLQDLDTSWLRVEASEADLDGLDPSVLDGLKRLGVRIHLDRFGCGDASISLLTRVDPAAVKLDPRIVRGMLDDASILRLARAIAAAASTAGIDVIAEAVDLPATARVLEDLGCHLAQGTLYGTPAAAPQAFDEREIELDSTPVSSTLL